MSNQSSEKLRAAFGRLQAQDLSAAERLCTEVLGESPRSPDALHLLGVVRLAGGKPDEAASLIAQALEGKPQDAAMVENLGVAELALRNYLKAERAFRKAFTLGSTNPSLYMRLGIALASQGKLADAAIALRNAAAASPDVPDIHLNLGIVLAEQGRMQEALASFEKVLALQPGNALAHFNVGNLHRIAGRLAEAEQAYQRVLGIMPRDPDTCNNLGLVYEQQRRLDEAATCYRQALALRPDHYYSRSNLGNVLRAQGRLEEATACYEEALAIRPDFVDAMVNLGNARAEQGRLDDARALYERVLRLDPRNAEAHRNLGKLFASLGRMEDAIANCRRAVECDPSQDGAHSDLGQAYLQNGDLETAAACFHKALDIRSANTSASYGLAETLKLQGRLREAAHWYGRTLEHDPNHLQAMGGLIHAQQHMCSWSGLEQRWQRLRDGMSATHDGKVSPFSVLSLPSTAAEQQDCAVSWARRNVEPLYATRSALGFDFTKRRRRDRLRIGYLAWGLHRHATGHWAPQIFELHDRARCEVIAYSYGPDDGSDVRARIRNAADAFVEIARETHVAAARRIYADEVDVLVDLTGYTFGMRYQIVAVRPAPVQVNWFYPGTMGTRCMDYFIADSYVVPPDLDAFFTERVARLPDCYMITDRKRPVSERTPTRAECGLPDAGLVFCCFNQAYKILPDVFASWMRIMKAVPGSVLWLLESNRWATENLRHAATEYGVAGERIVFAPHKPMSEHLARYRIADLALDTFPYTSHTTAADALWVGCPLVTRMGNTFASRVAGSVLINAGMRELVADDAASCERLAVELATAAGKLADIRRRLAETRDSCPLFDTPRFMRNLENAYESMFEAFLKSKG